MRAPSSHDPGAYDCHGAGHLFERQNVVGGKNRTSIWLYSWRFAGTRTHGDEKVVSGEYALTFWGFNSKGVGVNKRSTPIHESHVVARQRIVNNVDFLLNYPPDMSD